MLDNEEFPYKIDDLFPLPVYVSAIPRDNMTIGLYVHKNGKIEEFEGNDEANPATYDLIDDILGTGDQMVVVYGYHGVDLVDSIRESGFIPEGIYMSPDKQYASGYWNMKDQRVLFSCKAKKSDFRRESEYDWKTKKKTKITNFRFV